MQAEFVAALVDLVSTFPQLYSGMLRQEVLIDSADSRRVQYVSAWVDEAALVRYAGEEWRSRPVTFPDEERFLVQPLSLRHLEAIELDAPRG